MAPINSSLAAPASTPGARWASEAIAQRLLELTGNVDGVIHTFQNDGLLTFRIPTGYQIPWRPWVEVVVLNGADMVRVAPSILKLPPEAADQMTALVTEVRQLRELRSILAGRLTLIDGILTQRTDQICQLGGVIVTQVKAVDGEVFLDDMERALINTIKGPILDPQLQDNAAVAQTKAHNQTLITHGQKQVAAVKEDLQVAQAENTVLRGESLGKQTLQAPPAVAGHKKAGYKMPRKPAKPRMPKQGPMPGKTPGRTHGRTPGKTGGQ